MTNKALKQYIEKRYFVKIKKARIWGLCVSLLPYTCYVITHKKQLDHLSSGWELSEYKMYESLTEILETLKAREKSDLGYIFEAHCKKCKTSNLFIVKHDVPYEITENGKTIKFLGKKALCKRCYGEVYVKEVEEYNKLAKENSND